MEKAHRVAVRWLHALRSHITCKNASKWIDVRERVEILVRNKDGSLLSLLPFELPVSLKKKKWCKKVLHVLTNVDLQGCFPIVKKKIKLSRCLDYGACFLKRLTVTFLREYPKSSRNMSVSYSKTYFVGFWH